MREYDYKKLISEKNTLENLISEVPDTAFIDKISLESRLDSVLGMLDDVDVRRLSKKTVFTFRGKPVHESYGITAEFSGKAIESLNTMITSVVASLNNNLNYSGRIPNREQHQLLITGTATGSFGFEFELPEPDGDLLAQRNGTENAIDEIQLLLQHGVNGTDEQISEVIEEIHPRAVRHVHDFLNLMQRNEALFAMEFNEKLLRINSNTELNRLIERFSDENINETTKEFKGEFQGVLPSSRSFEFKEHANGNVIKGKIDTQFVDPDAINRDYLHEPVTVEFNIIQVGQAKPKYTLEDIKKIINVS